MELYSKNCHALELGKVADPDGNISWRKRGVAKYGKKKTSE